MKKQFPWKMTLRSAAILVITTILLCMILSVLVGKELMAEHTAKTVMEVLRVLLVFLCCSLAVKKSGKTRIQIVLSIIGTYLVVMLIMGTVICDRQPVKFQIIPIVLVGAAVASGVFASMRKERRR